MYSPAIEPPQTAEPAVEDPVTDDPQPVAAQFSASEPPPSVSTAWSENAPPSALDQAYPTRMSDDDLATGRVQPGLDAGTVAQRRGQLAAVFGVAVDFQLLLELAGQGTMRDTVDREPRVRLDLTYTVSASTDVRDVSVYGTAAGFRGTARHGSAFTANAAWEYNATQHWALALDLA
jgi:hypothetical protein